MVCSPLRLWFTHRFGEPTVAQRQAWPVISSGQNLLLAAPTGSGKTLAAFVPILDDLLRLPRPNDQTQCLYVAPYRALLADTRRTLRLALRQLREWQPAAAELRVGMRTGDSSARQRRLHGRRPPLILLTTPESLAVMLSQPTAGRLAGIRWVVVDEVHALAAGKRGADLAISLERLAALAHQPIQRIGLSATCTPLSEAARYLCGERPCTVAAVMDTAPLELNIEPLTHSTSLHGQGPPSSFLSHLVDRLAAELRVNRTTLVFTNSRGQAERLTWALRRRYPELTVGVHHSSLSAERRRSVERRLKQGRLHVVVSSTSLELGIDCGTVDGVVLVHPPGGVARLLQRVGRSGHAPGRLRRGLVLTASAAELLEMTVTGASGRAGQLEPIQPARQPLDVLCQQLVGIAMQRAWTAEEAFALVRRAYPYHDLSRQDFDDCLAYLSGRCGSAELPPRLQWQDGAFSIIDARTARLMLRNLGTIVAEEARLVETEKPAASADDWPIRVAVGEVDEPFADRLQPGDRFLLDGRCLEYRKKSGRTLLVQEVLGRPATPRWTGSGWPLSSELARRLYLLRVQAAEALRDGTLPRLLEHDYGLTGAAVEALVELFERQERVSEIPDGGICLVEAIEHDLGTEYYVHTPLNRAGNEALAWVAALRLADQSALPVAADLGFVLSVRGPGADLAQLLKTEDFDADLARAVAASDAWRERFHQAALVGLMLLRNPLGGRRRVGGHDWAERRLFERLRELDADFVLLRQARREVLHARLDAASARQYIENLPPIRVRRLPATSPLAESWTQLQVGADNVTRGDALRNLQAALLRTA